MNSEKTNKAVSMTQMNNLGPETSKFLSKLYNKSVVSDEDNSWNCQCDECRVFMNAAGMPPNNVPSTNVHPSRGHPISIAPVSVPSTSVRPASSVPPASAPVSKPSELSTVVFIERESSEKTVVVANDGDAQKGFVREKLQTIKKFGIVDFLVVVELAVAIFFIFSSVSLGVARSSHAWTFFLLGVLIIVPLVPVIGFLGSANPKAPYVFKVLTLVSGALNVFWALFALSMHSTTNAGFTLLLSVAIMQFCCLGSLLCYDYNETNEEEEAPARKARKPTPSMRSEHNKTPLKGKSAKKQAKKHPA